MAPARQAELMAATVGIVTTVLQCRQGLIVWL